MIDFEAIEFFFAKEKKHMIPFPLKVMKKPPLQKAPIQKAIKPKVEIKVEHKKPIEKRKAPPSPSYTPKQKTEEKKDNFYSEWEKKYRALQAENLLAKKPFKRLALFVVNKKTSKEFAEKISSAVNTRLMKTIFVVSDAPIEELIKKHQPTHIITTKTVTNFIPLPGVLIDDLSQIEKSAEQKKELWDKLKTSLKG